MAYVNVSAVPVVPVASLPAAAVSPDADVSATGSLPPQPVRTPAAMVIEKTYNYIRRFNT